MNKIFTVLFIILAAIKPAGAEEEQKFINPLFYKTMKPVSRGTWRTKITPKSLISDNKGTVLKQKCTLIENTMETVTLQCEGAYTKSQTDLFRFVLGNKSYGDLIVYMYEKYPSEKEYINRDTLAISLKKEENHK